MTNKPMMLFKRISGIIISVSILIAGACLIFACLNIYYSGNGYSAQIVKDAFSPIAIPVFACIAFTLLGFVVAFINPDPSKKINERVPSHILARMTKKADMANADSDTLNNVLKERRMRKTFLLIEGVIFTICAAVFLAYALNGNNFHSSEINSSMIRAMLVLISCLVLPFGISVVGIFFNDRSIKREIDLLKLMPSVKAENQNVSSKRSVAGTVVIIVVIVIAVAAIVYGAFSGGTADVLTKAVNICTECIGLG